MISNEQLTEFLVKAGMNTRNIVVSAEDYVMPTPGWITKDLSASMNKFLFNSGIKFNYNQFDCKKFAKTASTIADWCWAKTTNKEAALAFGMFGYLTALHAINVAIHRNDKQELYLAFYEPQLGIPGDHAVFSPICLTPVTLTQDDIASCLFCWFF